VSNEFAALEAELAEVKAELVKYKKRLRQRNQLLNLLQRSSRAARKGRLAARS
jgi:hypothetical protein